MLLLLQAQLDASLDFIRAALLGFFRELLHRVVLCPSPLAWRLVFSSRTLVGQHSLLGRSRRLSLTQSSLLLGGGGWRLCHTRHRLLLPKRRRVMSGDAT